VDMRDMGHPCMKGLCQIIPVFDAVFYCIDDDIPVKNHVEVCSDLVQLNMAGVLLKAEFEQGASWGELEKFSEPYMQLEADLSDGERSIKRHLENSIPRETVLEVDEEGRVEEVH
jgi:hypothetical protein